MSLYLKYRPTGFKQIFGNQETVETLQQMTATPDECPHVFLFHGGTGCGKTTLARIVGKELGIKGQDLRELDSAQFTGIDVVREIRKQAQYKALEGNRRMWIMDECHAMSSQAQEGLLKILEDTPSHVYFALCTTEPQKLKPTLRGRCQQFEVKPLSDKEMTRLLIKISKAEGQPAQKKVILQIVQDSQGHPRQALQILDQTFRVDPKRRLKVARQTAAQQNQSIELCRALIGNQPWSKVRGILKGLKNEDPESVRRHVLGYAQSVVLNGDNEQAGAVMEEFLHPMYDTGFAGVCYAAYVVTKG